MNNYEYEIVIDETARNPRNEFDNLCTFYALKNRNYMTGGKEDKEFSYSEDLEDTLKQLRKEKALIVEFHNPHVGTCYAVVTRDQLQEEYIKHGYSMRKALYHARNVIKGEVSDWLAWGEGEVYGWKVSKDGEELESVWGYYGDAGRKYAEQEAKNLIKYYEQEDQKEEQQITNRLALACGA